MNRRLNDQVLILEAISNVRKELKARADRGESWIEIGKVMVRLTTLYSLLNVDQIKVAVEAADTRDERKAA